MAPTYEQIHDHARDSGADEQEREARASDPQQVALWLLRDMGNHWDADVVASTRQRFARRPDRKNHWYQVSLWIWRLAHVHGGEP